MLNIDDLIINENISVLAALQKLEETGRRILFIAPAGRLAAVLTDSDVRKYILRGGNLNDAVQTMANYNPKTLLVEQRSEARDFLHHNSIDAVPLLDKQGAMVDIVFVNDVDDIATHKRVTLPVVIMAGGLGTRLYPYTKILPKPLIPIGDTPIIELIIENFYGFGCRDFTLIVNHKRNMIKSYFADVPKDYELHFVDEDMPLGTGGGLSLIRGSMHEKFFFTNCDTLINADYADVVKYHEKQGNAVTMVCAMKHFTIPYGVVELDETGTYSRIAEKPAYNLMTNTGMYLVEPAVLQYVKDGEKQGFPDVIDRCRAAGMQIGVYPVGEGSWMDMGQLEELEAMRRRIEGNS